VPTISDFNIATDLKVEFFLPDEASNLFIIGISKIGGEDVLAGEGLFTIGVSLIGGDDLLGDNEFVAFTWQDLSCTTSQAKLDIGGQIIDQLYFQPEPASATLTLQTWDYDPSHNSSFRPGVPVRVRLVKDAVDQVIWTGVVDTITGAYSPEGTNLLRVTAFDSFRRLVNTRIPLFDSDTDFPGYVTPYEQLELIAQQFGTSMHSSSSDPGGEIPSTILTDVIPSSLVYEAIQVGLGLFWLDPVTQEFVFVPRPIPGVVPEDTLVIGNNHGTANHLCMTNIVTSADSDVVFNSLKVELKSDDTVSVLVENTDSIQLYGKYAQDVILNTTNSDELTRWANSVFNQSPTNLVDSVETLTKDRQGNLTEAAFLLPGELIGVDYSEDVLVIDDYYTITKVSHFIDPDNWLTTLDLWKEV
jgi:hypothetical protein